MTTCPAPLRRAPWSPPRPAAIAAPRAADPSRLWRALGLPAQRAAAPSPIYTPGECRCFRDLIGLLVGAEECALALCVDDRPQAPAGGGTGEGAGEGWLSRLLGRLDAAVAGAARDGDGEAGAARLLGFLEAIDRAAPAELDVHLIVDRRASVRAPEVREWLIARRRFHLHFASDHERWLTRAREWLDFAELRQRSWAAPQGVEGLRVAIERHLGAGGRPFAWARSEDATLTNFARFVARRGR